MNTAVVVARVCCARKDCLSINDFTRLSASCPQSYEQNLWTTASIDAASSVGESRYGSEIVRFACSAPALINCEYGASVFAVLSRR
jgi:hypothetical protein